MYMCRGAYVREVECEGKCEYAGAGRLVKCVRGNRVEGEAEAATIKTKTDNNN